MNAISGDRLRGHLETMVLSILERGDAHGLDIMRQLDAAGCGLLKLREGTLYPALYRLEAAGMISVVRKEKPPGGRGAARLIYRLSGKGRRHLAKGRQDWVSFVEVIGRIVGAPA
ncbi:lineage-specific thermal regulator protein [Maioricimonas rarisocia]|uniref:Lineage-specific thermal regulator protein n=1 Tax=Maioricimonas rarisocia TaxID=2528026 RepID=A0A517Z912_9PLAN|nr:helix-turn-helix transcriptional regulator [Maioricimonas rarisocia]QDU38968.1 lineage-specific thermal regulator protein [Maioricimonas rarisocia]